MLVSQPYLRDSLLFSSSCIVAKCWQMSKSSKKRVVALLIPSYIWIIGMLHVWPTGMKTVLNHACSVHVTPTPRYHTHVQHRWSEKLWLFLGDISSEDTNTMATKIDSCPCKGKKKREHTTYPGWVAGRKTTYTSSSVFQVNKLRVKDLCKSNHNSSALWCMPARNYIWRARQSLLSSLCW